MSSAVNDVIEDEINKNEYSKYSNEEESTNLMTFIPKAEDNYLETLRNCGVTVQCVPKKNSKPKPEPELDVKQESDDDDGSFDVKQFLNNSSISIVPKSKPSTKPNSPKSFTDYKSEDEDDPFARLTSLGCGISIQRKKSVDSTSSEGKLSESVLIVKKTPSKSPPAEETLKSSEETNEQDEKSDEEKEATVTIIKKSLSQTRESTQSTPDEPPENNTHKVTDLQEENSSKPTEPSHSLVNEFTEGKNSVSSELSSSELKEKELTEQDHAESSDVKDSFEKAPLESVNFEKQEPPAPQLERLEPFDNPGLSKSKRNSNTVIKSSRGRRRGTGHLHNTVHERLNETTDKDTDQNRPAVKLPKRGRGRGRPPSRAASRAAAALRRHHYESDEEYKSQARASETRRQTRGKKISLSNYSESEDSDFEQYIYDNSQSPVDLPTPSTASERRAAAKTEDLGILQKEIKTEEDEDIRKYPEQTVENSTVHQESTTLPVDEQDSSQLSDNPLKNSSSKISISILKNEDYSEVLRSKTDLTSSLSLDNDQYENETPSESADSCNFTESRSVTPAVSTGYLSDSSKTDESTCKKRRLNPPSQQQQTERYPSDDLFCWYCKRNFSKKTLFWRHISSHIRLPHVYLTRVTPEEIEQHCGPGYKLIPSNSSSKMSSLKLTLKTNNNHEFEIINKENSADVIDDIVKSNPEDFQEGDEEYPNSFAENSAVDDNMELDETIGNNDDSMELDDPVESSNHSETNEKSQMNEESYYQENAEDGENQTDEASETTYNETNVETASFTEPNAEEGEQIIPDTADPSETDKSSETSETSQQTYIPGVRIRSLESVQRLDNSTPESSSGNSTPSVQNSSPTLRVRTNLTSPQSNNIGQMQNQLAMPNNMYDQQQHYQSAGYGSQNPYQQHQPQNMYSQQSMTYNSNGGYSSYSSYNQTTYVGNGNFSPNPVYWSNAGGSMSGQHSENIDPLSMNEEDPLKLPTTGEKEQETNGNLLKTFLDGSNSSNLNMNNDNSSMGEFMPLDRLISATTCSVCSERFPDVPSLEDHKRRLNHYGSNSSSQTGAMQHSQSSALQPLGSGALQTLASAHGSLGPNMQPIQHQIRVQHNVIVNNVIQQQPMAPLPPYGQPQMVDNSMQQLAQQVNRMPPPNSQYGPYGASQPPPYGQPPSYRMPALPAPAGSTSQQYSQNNYGSQYGQYPNNQPIPLPAPPTSVSNQQNSSQQQQYGQRPGGPVPGRPVRPPGMPTMRPRGQAYLPTTQAGPPPSSNVMRPPGVRGAPFRPPMNRAGQQMGPRMQGPIRPGTNTATRMRRPVPAPIQQPDQKRKRMDMIIPDRHEDPDCHVIAVQQRNDDLPVIQNVQGNVQDQDPLSKAKDSMIHLTDSITLSVRGKEQNGSSNNQSPTNQKPSAASSVADILATRGITVTPAAKSNSNGNQSKSSDNGDVAQVAINLNNAVSIIPAQKSSVERPPRPPSTVDLTDDHNSSTSDPLSTSILRPNKPYKCSICPKQFNSQDLYTQHVTKHRTLPFRCDQCSAAYPKQVDLINHKKNCRAMSTSASDLGLPIVDLRKTQVVQNLSRLGIHHYIPLAQGNNNGIFGLPVVSVDGARNPNIVNLSALGSNQLLPLGPVRQLPVQNRPH